MRKQSIDIITLTLQMVLLFLLGILFFILDVEMAILISENGTYLLLFPYSLTVITELLVLIALKVHFIEKTKLKGESK